MNYRELKRHFIQKLVPAYPSEEVSAVFFELLKNNEGQNRMWYALNDTRPVVRDEVWFEQLERLLAGEPVQHITGWADFRGLRMKVNKDVLIPRPETEELVDRIVKLHHQQHGLKVLDIGTGSGCIALALKNEIPNCVVTGIDASVQALEVAMKNADFLGLKVTFKHSKVEDFYPEGTFDVIVSNPPYIPVSEASALDKNVLDYEPHLALFAPENDPLYFYKVIAEFGRKYLKKPGGRLYFEAHHIYAVEAYEHIAQHADAQLVNDMFGKPRFIFCKSFLNDN